MGQLDSTCTSTYSPTSAIVTSSPPLSLVTPRTCHGVRPGRVRSSSNGCSSDSSVEGGRSSLADAAGMVEWRRRGVRRG
jgi:hypothetical protein